MFRKAAALFLAGVFAFSNSFAYSADALSLNALIEEARKSNSDILAAKKRWEASLARVPQAKALENPSIGFSFEKISRGTLKLNKTMPEDRALSFSQFLPLFGKLSLKGKISLVESQMFAAEYKNKELEVVSQLKNAYYDLFMNYKEIELDQESFSLLEGVTKVAEAKFSVGDISQEEVYKLHLEVARLGNVIKNLELEKKAKQALINVLLNKDPEMELVSPVLNEEANFNTDIHSLYQLILLNQPELLIFSYAIEKNKYAKSLANKSFFPDLMAQITQRGLSAGAIGPWDLMLAFTVPLWFWTKQRYEVKEAVANLEEAEAAYKAMQNRAFAQVKDLAAKIEIAKNKIQLYQKDLMPILENSIEVSLSAFSAGKGDFMALLDTQRMLVDTKMDYYKALAAYNMSLADLERVVGINFTANQEVKK